MGQEVVPEGQRRGWVVIYGYQVAQALEYVELRRDLTRENIMRVATRMDHVALPMLYPGITATTSPTNCFALKRFQMFRFNGEEWLPFRPIVGR